MGQDGSPCWRAGRLTERIPDTGEDFHDLVTMGGARIEHIVSSAAPDLQVQVQDWDEWVLVLAGRAELDLLGTRVELSAGDWVVIEAGTPHRVLMTSPGTHWLAVHGGAHPQDPAPTPAVLSPRSARA